MDSNVTDFAFSQLRTLTVDFDGKARSELTRQQNAESQLIPATLKVEDLSGVAFPETDLETISDSGLAKAEKQKLVAYLLGCWCIDQLGSYFARWTVMPEPTENYELYQSFSIAVGCDEG